MTLLISSCDKVRDYSCFVSTTHIEEAETSTCNGLIAPHTASSTITEEVIINGKRLDAKSQCIDKELESSTYSAQGCVKFKLTTKVEVDFIE